MLQRDYLLEVIARFVEVVTAALKQALALGSTEAAHDAEQAIAELLDLDPAVAMRLEPDSLVTMLVLSGIGDSVASYVAYTLDQLSGAYASMGDEATAALRRRQAVAVGEAFGCDPAVAPEGFAEQA